MTDVCEQNPQIRIYLHAYELRICLFFNWDSLHASLNSHNDEWSYKKKNHKKVKAYRKAV